MVPGKHVRDNDTPSLIFIIKYVASNSIGSIMTAQRYVQFTAVSKYCTCVVPWSHTYRHTGNVLLSVNILGKLSSGFWRCMLILGTPTRRRINSCLPWRSIDAVACSSRRETS